MPSQKVVPVKLHKDQIKVLDVMVKYGNFDGRSHAIRELIRPALNATIEASTTGKSWRAMTTWITEMKRLTKHMEAVAENSKEMREDNGQVHMDLDGVPKPMPQSV